MVLDAIDDNEYNHAGDDDDDGHHSHRNDISLLEPTSMSPLYTYQHNHLHHHHHYYHHHHHYYDDY